MSVKGNRSLRSREQCIDLGLLCFYMTFPLSMSIMLWIERSISLKRMVIPIINYRSKMRQRKILNRPRKMWPILGFIVISNSKLYVHSYYISLPFLQLYGKSSSTFQSPILLRPMGHEHQWLRGYYLFQKTWYQQMFGHSRYEQIVASQTKANHMDLKWE